MPYTHCPSCRLATFSAARHSSHDECPRCGTPLEPARVRELEHLLDLERSRNQGLEQGLSSLSERVMSLRKHSSGTERARAAR